MTNVWAYKVKFAQLASLASVCKFSDFSRLHFLQASPLLILVLFLTFNNIFEDHYGGFWFRHWSDICDSKRSWLQFSGNWQPRC